MKSPIEENTLHQSLSGLDPYKAYEMRMVAKDGEFETPSEIKVIGPMKYEDDGELKSKPIVILY